MDLIFSKSNIPKRVDCFGAFKVALNIAVNTRLLLKNRLEGLGVFTHETLRRLVADHPEHHFHFFFDRPFSEEFIYAKNITPHILSPQARHPVLFYAWFEWAVAAKLKALKTDLFLSQDGYLSLRSPVKQLPVIHDLNFHYFPTYFKKVDLLHYLYYFPKYARKATRIATVSEFSKTDIVKQYKVDPDRIDVVFNGADETVYFPPSPEEALEAKQSTTGGDPYFLFIGGLYPRKNLLRLVQAFEHFKMSVPSPVKLVLVGSANKTSGALLEAIEKSPVAVDIIRLGRVDNPAQIRALLGGALALTYVSSFEGFGLPIIEAQRCGTPVITADNTALPEVAGAAAVFVHHESIEGIAGGMQKVYVDAALRERLSQLGLENAKRFTWDHTATRLWESMEKCLEC